MGACGAQLAETVQQEQEAAANGIGSDGRPVVTKVEDFGMKLAHQFPWAPASAVAVGLALRRRFLSDPDSPSTVTRRLQVTKVLPKSSSITPAESLCAWQALRKCLLYEYSSPYTV